MSGSCTLLQIEVVAELITRASATDPRQIPRCLVSLKRSHCAVERHGCRALGRSAAGRSGLRRCRFYRGASHDERADACLARDTSARCSAIDKRTTRHPGYAASQRIRKSIEEAFSWIKTVAGLRQTKFRCLTRVDWAFTFATAAYDLVRVSRLVDAVP
jgi:hypothetical protein